MSQSSGKKRRAAASLLQVGQRAHSDSGSSSTQVSSSQGSNGDATVAAPTPPSFQGAAAAIDVSEDAPHKRARPEGAAAAAAGASQESAASIDLTVPAATLAAAAMADVWADEQPGAMPLTAAAAVAAPAAASCEQLFANGAALPVAAAAAFMPSYPQQPYQQPLSYSHVLNPAQHADLFMPSGSQQAAYGYPAAGRRGRAIRTPHAVPTARQINLTDSPVQAASPYSHHMKYETHPRPTSQLDALFHAAPPPHGHPPAYHAAAADRVVDLTQEGAAATATGGYGGDDVQVISHTQNLSSEEYNAFDPAHYTSSRGSAVDPYLAAYHAASTSMSSPPPPPPTAARPLTSDQMASLSKEQQAVVCAILDGRSVFFSGCAGTGKSHLLKLMGQFLDRRTTFFTASTGLAAVNIGGTTLHSFAGIGLGEGSTESLGRKAAGNKRSADRWRTCKVLIIDELSMISGQLFDKLEGVARHVRRNNEPFGGIQLVLSGDFLQLPPVKATKPTFRAESWNSLLGNLRMGVLPLKDECLLKKAHYTNLPPLNGVLPTKLNALKRDTADENGKHLERLPGKSVLFRAYDSGKSEAHMQLLAKDCPALAEIRLKQGAQVMLLKNLDPEAGLCNGSTGIIIDFVRIHMDAAHGGIDDDAITAELNGSTATAASAATADGSGGTDDGSKSLPAAAHIPFVNSDSYMPQSESHFGGRLEVSPGSHRDGPSVRVGNAAEVYLLPRVQFSNGVVVVIEADKFEIKVQDEVMAMRRQIPLTLAWALTIHKSQGMTLERAEINAQGMFENGQLYVAVSRVKSLQGLRLRGFTRDCMRTDHAVVAWYKQLAIETETSTRTLLQDVDSRFPGMAAALEAQKKQRAEEEVANGGAAAAASSAASSSSSTAGAFGSQTEAQELSQVSRLAADIKSEFSIKREGSVAAAAGSVASAASKKPARVYPYAGGASALAGPPPQSFRSPVKNPAVAAASTAVAAAELAHVNAINAGERDASPGVGTCCVCHSEPCEFAVLPCMHLCLCADCQKQFRAPSHADSPSGVVKQCPVCRQRIDSIKKIFMA